MAIIRKGDKKAESKLRSRAIDQSVRRANASDKTTNKAGLSFTNKSKTSITSDPSKIMVSKDKNGKVTAKYRGEDFKGPVSGGAISQKKSDVKRAVKRYGSGVIKGGKVVKGEVLKKKGK